MDGKTILAETQERIAQVAQPLAAHLLTLDTAIEQQERELGELKKARTQLRNAIKSIDPTLIPSAEKQKSTKGWVPAAQHMTALYEFLVVRQHEMNGGFHAAALTNAYPTELPIPYSSIHKVLAGLHEQGLVRLDSTARGGAKVYKLVIT